MLDLMEYEDDFELDGFDLEDGFEDIDDEADEWLVGSALGMGIGAGLGGAAATLGYDHSARLLKKYGGNVGRRIGKWMSDNPDARNLAINVGAGIGGGLGGGAGLLVPAAESEYEAETIEDMEALMEIALEGDSEDAEEALDGMIMRAFGPIRAAANMRRIMAAIRAKVAQLVARARRDPRLRSAARAAPMVLRRTAVKLLRMVAAGRPVTVQIALRVFAGELARVLQSSNRRAAASRAHRARAARSFARHRMQQRMRQRRTYGRRAY